MSAVPRPGTAGATRTCPHCKATILESSSVCPACRGHLKFDAPATDAAQRFMPLHNFVQAGGERSHIQFTR